MNKLWWEILDVEADADKKTIRRAYSQLIRQYHPEDEPEIYKEIREAYEYALYYINIEQSQIDIEIFSNDQEIKNINKLLYHQPQEKEMISQVEKLIQEEITDLIDGTRTIYESVDVNNISKWKEWFKKNKDHEEMILETLFEYDLDLLTNEIVVSYLREIIEKLPRKDKDIYKKRISSLRERNFSIRDNIKGGHWFYLLDVGTLVCLFSMFVSIYCIGVYGWKVLSSHSYQTLFHITFLLQNIVLVYQFFYVAGRNMNEKKKFFVREKKLISMAIIASIMAIIHVVTFFWFMRSPFLWILFLFIAFLQFIINYFMKQDFFLVDYERDLNDMSLYAVFACIVMVFVAIAGIIFMVRLIMSRNLYYFIVLGYILIVLYSLSRISVLFMREEFYNNIKLKLQRLLGFINLIGNVCAINVLVYLLFHDIDNMFSKSLSILVGITCLCSLLVAVLFLVLEKHRKQDFYKIFSYSPELLFSSMGRYMALKCKEGKEKENINEYERDLYSLYTFTQVIQKEGLKYYYISENNDIDNIIVILQKFNLFHSIELIKESLTIFPNKLSFLDFAEREKSVEANHDLLSKLTDEFCNDFHSIYEAVYEYVRYNKEMFKYK